MQNKVCNCATVNSSSKQEAFLLDPVPETSSFWKTHQIRLSPSYFDLNKETGPSPVT
jgi:hypothetical protein